MMDTSLRRSSMTRERYKVRNQTRPIWYLVKELSSRGRNQGKIPLGASFSNLPLRSRYADCLPMGKKWQFRDTHCFSPSHPCHPQSWNPCILGFCFGHSFPSCLLEMGKFTRGRNFKENPVDQRKPLMQQLSVEENRLKQTLMWKAAPFYLCKRIGQRGPCQNFIFNSFLTP